MRKYITDTELNEMPKKNIEAIKVVTPKPRNVVKKVINKKKFKK
jgi:hypothetical protein